MIERNPGGEESPQLLVDVNGVGYEVDADEHVLQPAGTGERVTLLTHLVVREDAQVLYGFLTTRSAATFRQLVKISVSAAHRPSSLPERRTRAGGEPAESGRLVKVPGIGKKTAERLLLELKGKLGDAIAAPAACRATRTATSCRRWWRSATDRSRRAEGAAGRVGVSEGIKLALKAPSRADRSSSSAWRARAARRGSSRGLSLARRSALAVLALDGERQRHGLAGLQRLLQIHQHHVMPPGLSSTACRRQPSATPRASSSRCPPSPSRAPR